MRISRIEFENFRNFKDYCKIDFPTDGNVAIIYGPNGVGKTTLHQLFQWVFYGEVHFNKTASTKMYNLQYEQEKSFGEEFSVLGKIDFEHPNSEGAIEEYSLRREWWYTKKLDDSKLIKKEFVLQKKVDGDWKYVTGDVSKTVEKILPSGLSPYFFFDGESMIADLNQKGKDSAKSLRKALYSIFDLNIYEQAKIHIGTQNSISTVLGKLYDARANQSDDQDLMNARALYRQACNQREEIVKSIETCETAIVRKKDEIQDLSERIGNAPSQATLEAKRQKAKTNIKTLESAIEREKKAFGSTLMSRYPQLLISRVVEEAQLRIGLKVEDEKLMPGLTKELVLSLLNEDACICGNCIAEKEYARLKELEKKFPPLSYKYIYDQFKSAALRWSGDYDKDILVKHLQAVFQYNDQIDDLINEIHEIDEAQKASKNVDTLITKRAEAERNLEFWEKKLKDENQNLGLRNQLVKQRKKKLDDLLEANTGNKVIDFQMEVMEAVRMYFESTLTSSTKMYSESLAVSIQDLLNKMLTSTRKVSMTSDFELIVKDSFGDEAKSEGQFAVVSFAYIGGIFKLLRDVNELKGKEFPLILDGPFSKLDVIQRQNVINTIPTYAPQVILFSKDDINDCFDEDVSDYVWTIYSNDERNVSYIKKGYDPEVFMLNGNYN